jgi:hypothetical protein
VWNSPFSAQGSAPLGSAARRSRSKSRPAKVRSSLRGSTQVRIARSPPSIISRASARVSRCQSGNSGEIPAPAKVYEREMAGALQAAKAEGVTHVVFGDLFL